MPYPRVVFRLDYEPHFEMFDSVGKTMGILSSESSGSDKFLPDLLENKQGHGVAAKYTSPDNTEIRNLTVEPTCIHGSFEILDGVNSSNVEEHVTFKKLIKIVNNLREQYCIETIQRSGIRFYHLDYIDCGPEGIVPRFNRLINNYLLSNIEGIIGDIEDSSIVLDGKHSDGTKYHFRFGPYNSHEARRYFPESYSLIQDVDTYNCIVDIDIYELSFNLSKTVSYAKWCYPAIQKAHNILDIVRKSLTDIG